MFVKINKKPNNFVDLVTKHRPKNVKIGMRKPIVLNNLRTVNFLIFSVCIILSLITADTTMDSQHIRNGMLDNSPFFIKETCDKPNKKNEFR